jgi:hypothetical protein
MPKYSVTIASTIYYQEEIEAESIADIDKDFMDCKLDFTDWRELELESNIHDIYEVK